MNYVNTGGREVAAYIASVYATHPAVQAVLLGGSIARGWGDRYSDLEIGVFWQEAPTDEDRMALVRNTGGDMWSFRPHAADRSGPSGEHYGLNRFTLGGKEYDGLAYIDTKHLTVADTEQWLREVLVEWDTAGDKQRLLSALQDAVPLYGHDLIASWSLRVASYPDELAIKIVQQNLWFGPWFFADTYISRDDVVILNQHLIAALECLLQILCALNRCYYPSSEPKWIQRRSEQMAIAPSDLYPRIKQVFRLEPQAAMRQMTALVYETIDLVDEHLPQVNTTPLFAGHEHINTAWARKKWARSPGVKSPPFTLLERVGRGMEGAAG